MHSFSRLFICLLVVALSACGPGNNKDKQQEREDALDELFQKEIKEKGTEEADSLDTEEK